MELDTEDQVLYNIRNKCLLGQHIFGGKLKDVDIKLSYMFEPKKKIGLDICFLIISFKQNFFWGT